MPNIIEKTRQRKTKRRQPATTPTPEVSAAANRPPEIWVIPGELVFAAEQCAGHLDVLSQEHGIWQRGGILNVSFSVMQAALDDSFRFIAAEYSRKDGPKNSVILRQPINCPPRLARMLHSLPRFWAKIPRVPELLP